MGVFVAGLHTIFIQILLKFKCFIKNTNKYRIEFKEFK